MVRTVEKDFSEVGLMARNMAGFHLGTTDMGTFGHMFRAVVPENEEACAEIGWKPLHVQRGFKPEDNVVTITSIRAISDPLRTGGEKVESHLDYLVDWVKRMIEPYEASLKYTESHVLLVSPVVASILAKGGYSKEKVNQYLMDHAMVSARAFEWNIATSRYWPEGTDICDLAKKGNLPKEWCKSTDPDRLVPLMLPKTQFLVVVTGDPTRNRSCVYRQNYMQGYATSKKIRLPVKWDKLLGELNK